MPAMDGFTKAPTRDRLDESGVEACQSSSTVSSFRGRLYCSLHAVPVQACPGRTGETPPAVDRRRAGSQPAYRSDCERRQPGSCRRGHHCRWRGDFS